MRTNNYLHPPRLSPLEIGCHARFVVALAAKALLRSRPGEANRWAESEPYGVADLIKQLGRLLIFCPSIGIPIVEVLLYSVLGLIQVLTLHVLSCFAGLLSR